MLPLSIRCGLLFVILSFKTGYHVDWAGLRLCTRGWLQPHIPLPSPPRSCNDRSGLPHPVLHSAQCETQGPAPARQALSSWVISLALPLLTQDKEQTDTLLHTRCCFLSIYPVSFSVLPLPVPSSYLFAPFRIRPSWQEEHSVIVPYHQCSRHLVNAYWKTECGSTFCTSVSLLLPLAYCLTYTAQTTIKIVVFSVFLLYTQAVQGTVFLGV